MFKAVNFKINEALLTRELLLVCKQENATFSKKTGPRDCLNITYSLSNITKGRAIGIVFVTRAFIEISAIAT